MKLKIKNTLSRSSYPLLLVIVALGFAILGAHLIIASHAATPYASTTAVSGSLASPATITTDSSASSGKSVTFGGLHPVQGVYNGNDPGGATWTDPDEFNTWLGSAATTGAQVYGDYNSAGWLLPQLSTWVNAEPNRIDEISLDMFPGSMNLSAPDVSSADAAADATALANGAAGDYNSNWKAFAQSLVNDNLADSIIRPGWECNGTYFSWSASGNEANYAEYFRQIVTSMRSVAPKLTFDWNCGAGTFSDGQAVSTAYPGDQYVTYIGDDPYDDSYAVYPTSGTITTAMQQSAWQEYISSTNGLGAISSFAAAHSKYVLLGEWGLWDEGVHHGGGDDPYYIQQMYTYINTPSNRVAAAFYFNNNGGSGYNNQINSGTFSNSATLFQQLFGKEAAGSLPD
jgi:hypothetical protein